MITVWLRESHRDNHILLYSDLFQELGFFLLTHTHDLIHQNQHDFFSWLRKIPSNPEKHKHISLIIYYSPPLWAISHPSSEQWFLNEIIFLERLGPHKMYKIIILRHILANYKKTHVHICATYGPVIFVQSKGSSSYLGGKEGRWIFIYTTFVGPEKNKKNKEWRNIIFVYNKVPLIYLGNQILCDLFLSFLVSTFFSSSFVCL